MSNPIVKQFQEYLIKEIPTVILNFHLKS